MDIEENKLSRVGELLSYEKVKDILANYSDDYDSKDKGTREFFARLQNKLLYAVTRKTASALKYNRSNRSQKYAGLVTFAGKNPTRKDAKTAKNYLYPREAEQLRHLVEIIYQEAVWNTKYESSIKLQQDWLIRVDEILTRLNLNIWDGSEGISSIQANKRVIEELEAYRAMLDFKKTKKLKKQVNKKKKP